MSDERLLLLAQAAADADESAFAEFTGMAEGGSGAFELRAIARLNRALRECDAPDSRWTPLLDPERSPTNDPAQARLLPQVGSTWGQLRLLAQVGRGGCGTVYLAHDPALDREVALKLLSTGEKGKSQDSNELLREGQLLARVRHPNVAVPYQVEERDGLVGISMEYIHGKNLAEIVREQGRFGAREAVAIGLEVASALAAVHAVGIVHGDVKAENLIREEGGRYVLVDFGIGAEPGGVHAPTGGVGTPLYSAQEVLDGDPASARSDIYSFGVLLFFLASGTYPVVGRSLDELKASHERGSRVQLRDLRPDLPVRFLDCVRKALARDPDDRFQTVGELEVELSAVFAAAGSHSSHSPETSSKVKALSAEVAAAEREGQRAERQALGPIPTEAPTLGSPRRNPGRDAPGARRAVGLYWAMGALVVMALGIAFLWRSPIVWSPFADSTEGIAKGTETSIAVLPFDDMSRDGKLEYLGDGTAEQISSVLSRVAGLRVTARTSAFSFRKSEIEVREIGRLLQVDKVLEGSVREIGRRLRVTVQLVNTLDGFSDWSRAYDLEIEEAHTIQAQIAQDVAELLRLELAAADATELARHSHNPDAYLLYLKGRHAWNQRTPESVEESIRLFQQATRLDSEYALAWVGQADAYHLLEVYTDIAPEDAASRARAALERAFALDDSLPEAYASLAVLREKKWDWEGADEAYRRSIELAPGDSTTRAWYAQYLAGQGRPREALDQVDSALELDPLSAYTNQVKGNVHYAARRYTDAVRQFRFVLKLNPEYRPAHEMLAYTYTLTGRHDLAIASALEGARIAGTTRTSEVLAFAYAMAGRTTESQEILARLLQLRQTGTGSAGDIAIVYGALGDHQLALAWMEKALVEGDYRVTQLMYNPVYDPLRSDARFRRLAQQVGFR